MILEVLIFFVSLVFLAYLWHKKCGSLWSKQGVPQDKVNPFPFGNSPALEWDTIIGNVNAGQSILELYNRTKQHKMYGTYSIGGMPVLMINDLDLVKQVLVKDFPYFINRNANTLPRGGAITDEIWSNMIIQIQGEEWRKTRNTFTPIFTTGKMKMMVQFIQGVSEQLVSEVEKFAQSGDAIDLKEIFAKFSMDGIASCAFGMNAESFTNKKSKFVENAKGLFTKSARDMLLIMFSFIPGCDQILRLFKVPILRPKETKFFYDLLVTILRERKQTGVKRNDLVDMMVAALRDEDGETKEEIMVVATAVIFLAAGYDTTSITLSFLGYQLALKPEVQEKLQEEVDAACNAANGKMPDYKDILEMEYLDMVVYESLRLHSPFASTTRGVVMDYVIPGTEITIPKGAEVHIPIFGIQRDERHYETPLDFNPEHFTKEAKAKRHPLAFLAFGGGPRNCIGMRFALLEAKMAIIALLSRYSLRKCNQTPSNLTLEPGAFLCNTREALMVKIEKRESPSM